MGRLRVAVTAMARLRVSVRLMLSVRHMLRVRTLAELGSGFKTGVPGSPNPPARALGLGLGLE